MEQQSSKGCVQDMRGKVFAFPEETKTACVKLPMRLPPHKQCFTKMTVCHRTFTDLERSHAVFSMSTPSAGNGFLTLLDSGKKKLSPHVQNARADFEDVDYVPKKWYSICTTWDRSTGQVAMWVNGERPLKKYVTKRPLTGLPIVVLGQDQDGYGGGFEVEESFVGKMTDVHMWDYVLKPCEIKKFMKDQKFKPGNVLNWGALEFNIEGNVLIEDMPEDICPVVDLSGTVKIEPDVQAVRDFSGKVLLFSEESASNFVKLTPSQENFTALTVCHRTTTDIKRDHALFSLALPTGDNAFLVYWNSVKQALSAYVHNNIGDFGGVEYKLNKWHSICTTWNSATGLVDMWLNGKQLIKKYTSEKPLTGKPIITLGQEQDGYGCKFSAKQCFVGMMTDVHMWDYVLPDSEIKKFMNDEEFTPGNVVNWEALAYESKGRVFMEDEDKDNEDNENDKDKDECCPSDDTEMVLSLF